MSETINIANEFPEMLRDLWRPTQAGRPSNPAFDFNQMLDQRYGHMFYEPCHDRALGTLLEKIEVRVAELLETVDDDISEEVSENDLLISDLETQVDQLTEQLAAAERERKNLQERLDDALEACGTPEFAKWEVPSGIEFAEIHVESSVPKESNGVTAPKSGVTKRVWEIADEITRNRETGGFPATKGEVVAKATAEGIKETTAQAAYSSWCKFHSINAKDTSKPYVHKEPKVKAEIVVGNDPMTVPVEVVSAPAVLPQFDGAPLTLASRCQSFAPPPPLPVFLPPPPLPPQ